MGVKIFKSLLLLQIAVDSFQTFPEFTSQWSSQKRVGDFWNFKFLIFNDFFFENFKFTIGETQNLNYLQIS